MSFVTATNGNPLRASDLNQYGNVFNGATASTIQITQTTTTSAAMTLQLPGGVAANTSFLTGQLSGDPFPRIGIYYTSAGTLGIGMGYGNAAYTGRLEASASISGGWSSLQAFTVNGTLSSYGGTSSASALSVNGNLQVNGLVTVNGGSGSVISNASSPQHIYTGTGNPPVWYAAGQGRMYVIDDGSFIHLQPEVTLSSSRNLALYGDNGTGGFAPMIRFEDGGNTYFLGPLAGGNGQTFSGVSTYNGTIAGTSATISHGMVGGHSPLAVVASTGSTGSYAQWTDCGTGAYGSSTYTIYTGASGYQVWALCFTN